MLAICMFVIICRSFLGIKAVELALISFAPSRLSKQVAWFTDNTNVVSIVQSGSKVTELQDLALRIFMFASVLEFHSR